MTDWGDVPKFPKWEAPEVELHPGDLLAWTVTDYGLTDGFSLVHRVFDDHAYCGEWIPGPVRHLSKLLSKKLPRCDSCQHLYEIALYAAQHRADIEHVEQEQDVRASA